MSNVILETRQLRKTFGALVATGGVDFDVREGETHAVIGPNGAGKTTFIKQLSGELRPDEGTVHFAGEDITALAEPKRSQRGLARSFQITSVYRDFTALDNVALAVQAHSGHSFRFWATARADKDLAGSAFEFLKKVNLQDRARVLAA
jgi:branched-chain amino acid transport system ATP-binding protein